MNPEWYLNETVYTDVGGAWELFHQCDDIHSNEVVFYEEDFDTMECGYCEKRVPDTLMSFIFDNEDKLHKPMYDGIAFKEQIELAVEHTQ